MPIFWENRDYRIPIKSWCREVEPEAMGQAVNLAKHPATVGHVALMPDCHFGYGMPIGGIIACDNAVIPNAVGVDIGCGMCAVRTDIETERLDEKAIKFLFGKLRTLIPVGFKHHQLIQKWEGFEQAPPFPVIQKELNSARRQLGTLGGGNHFIEIQAGSDGVIWLMLHSGSRNFGYKIARDYNRAAGELCKKKRPKGYSGGDDLAFLPGDSKAYREYLSAMNFALKFALENRHIMMKRFKEVLQDIIKCRFTKEINIHHNFAAEEKGRDRNVIVHRKGATSAAAGQEGIIPGSMGTSSYIVRGKGNKAAFQSCSHGAGRVMGRNQFNRSYTEAECNKAMAGIVFGRWNKGKKGKPDLSEAPQAYKNIDEVMASQADLVEILVKLRPLGVMKG